MLLHRINFDNRDKLYCGPHAIAAATGLSPQAIVELITAQRILGRSGIEEPATARRYAKFTDIKYMRFEEIAATLRAIGYKCHAGPIEGRPKVWQFIESLAKNPQPYPHILRISGHFLALSGCGRQIADTVSIQPEATEGGRYHGSSITHALSIQAIG